MLCLANSGAGPIPLSIRSLGVSKDALRDNDFAGGVEAELLSRARNHGNTLGGAIGVIDDEALGVDFSKDCDVWLIRNREEATRPTALVDCVDTVDQATHRAIKDVLGNRLSGGLPGLGDEVSERLHFRDEVGMGNWNWPTRAGSLEFRRVQAGIIVISSALAKVGDKEGPRSTPCHRTPPTGQRCPWSQGPMRSS